MRQRYYRGRHDASRWLRSRDGRARRRVRPGYADDAVQMMAGRTALARAGSLLPHLRPGMRVLDAGCGPGTITLGLADAVAPGGSVVGVDAEPSQVELARAAADCRRRRQRGVRGRVRVRPAVRGRRLRRGLRARPLRAPRAARRRLRRAPQGAPTGWCRGGGRARTGARPSSSRAAATSTAALRGHFELRRRAGGDPDAGGALPALAEQAGLEVDCVERRDAVDLSYPALAAYIADRLEAAEAGAAPAERSRLAAAAAAARRWQRQPDGMFTQRWVAVVARRA